MKAYTVIGEATEPEERIRLEWAESLREHLAAKEIGKKELIHRLAALGVVVTRQAVESWLAGKTAPRPHHQAAIGTVLNTPARRLFPIENLPKAASQ